MPKIFGISYLRVIKRSEMKNIRLTFATVTVLSFCSGFINPIWAGKSDEKNFEISRNLDIFNSLFKELNMFYVDTINAEKARANGATAESGMAMLVWQAVVSHEHWDGSVYDKDDIAQLCIDSAKELEKNF